MTSTAIRTPRTISGGSRYSAYLGHPIPLSVEQEARKNFPNPQTGLLDELRQIPTLRCPSLKREDHVVHYVSNGVDFNRYSANGSWHGGGPLRLSALPASPSSLFYLADGNMDRLPPDLLDYHDAWHELHLPFSGTAANPEPRIMRADDDRHAGRICTIYFDGHAEALPLTPEGFHIGLFHPGAR